MRVGLAALILVVASSLPVAAQNAPRFELAGGYAFLHDEDSTYNFPGGWVASVAAPAASWLDAVAEAGGSYKTLSIPGDSPTFSVYSFMAGPRFRLVRSSRIGAFAQVLFGAARASTTVVGVSDTVRDFAYQPGAGVDVALQRHLAVRLEGDYRIVRAEGGNSRETRVLVAAVIGVGR
jgi:hypothetical protein